MAAVSPSRHGIRSKSEEDSAERFGRLNFLQKCHVYFFGSSALQVFVLRACQDFGAGRNLRVHAGERALISERHPV